MYIYFFLTCFEDILYWGGSLNCGAWIQIKEKTKNVIYIIYTKNYNAPEEAALVRLSASALN